MTRQRDWQHKQKEKGNCTQCGQPRPPELSRLCRKCQTKKYRYRNEVAKMNRVLLKGVG